MKKTLLLLFLMLSSFPLVFAHDDHDLDLQIALAQRSAIGQELEPTLHLVFGNERVNLTVTGEDKTTVVGIVTEDGVITSITTTPLSDPTLNVYTDEDTVAEITDAENTLDAFQTALDEDRITYKAAGIVKKVKFGFLSFVGKIVSWFS